MPQHNIVETYLSRFRATFEKFRLVRDGNTSHTGSQLAFKTSEEKHLLDDVPDVTVSGDRHQSVVDGHIVELSRFFVAKKRIRYPQLVPAVFSEADLVDTGDERAKC